MKKKTELKVNYGSKGRILNKRGTQSERLNWQKHGEQIKIGKYICTRQLFRDSSGNAHNKRTCTYICMRKVFF